MGMGSGRGTWAEVTPPAAGFPATTRPGVISQCLSPPGSKDGRSLAPVTTGAPAGLLCE